MIGIKLRQLLRETQFSKNTAQQKENTMEQRSRDSNIYIIGTMSRWCMHDTSTEVSGGSRNLRRGVLALARANIFF